MAEFRILGPLEVMTPHGPLPLGGLMQRATLAILLLDANRVVPADQLADGLYRGEPPATAVTQVQRQISELRKRLGEHARVETRSPGYVIELEAGQLDLNRFEQLLADGEEALSTGDAIGAVSLLEQALDLWRGRALADLAAEQFALLPMRRLEELRLLALERKLQAELAAGRPEAVALEARDLVAAHPTRERFAAQLMLALYRTGRQIDALAAYRELRQALVDGFGVEPGPELRKLEARMLRQDSALDAHLAVGSSARSVLVTTWADSDARGVLAVGEALAQELQYEVLVATLARAGVDLPTSARAAAPARTAAFTTADAATDIARLAREQESDVVVVPGEGLEGLAALSTATIVSVSGRAFDAATGDRVAVAFAGTEDDWAALEVAAVLARACSTALSLVGPGAGDGRRDASRLLASASIAVQRVLGVQPSPVLAAPDAGALAEAVAGAAAVVVGAARHRRWRPQLAETVVVVRRGLRPGLLAPLETRTRYTWSLGDDHVQGGELSAL